jgi:hypothetical protein
VELMEVSWDRPIILEVLLSKDVKIVSRKTDKEDKAQVQNNLWWPSLFSSQKINYKQLLMSLKEQVVKIHANSSVLKGQTHKQKQLCLVDQLWLIINQPVKMLWIQLQPHHRSITNKEEDIWGHTTEEENRKIISSLLVLVKVNKFFFRVRVVSKLNLHNQILEVVVKILKWNL